MKKKIISLALVVIGFAVGASALSAVAAWTSPSVLNPGETGPCTPPNCNVAAPLNVGASLQEKLGPLNINTASLLDDIGLTIVGKIKLDDVRKGAGKVLTDVNGDGVGTWQALTGGGALVVTGDGVINAGSTGASAANLGSNWSTVFFTGGSLDSDGASAGGYAYRLNGQPKAAFYTGTDVKRVFNVTTTLECNTGGSSVSGYSFCVRVDGSGNLLIETGSVVSMVYIKTMPGTGTLSPTPAGLVVGGFYLPIGTSAPVDGPMINPSFNTFGSITDPWGVASSQGCPASHDTLFAGEGKLKATFNCLTK